jgi:hypothetical protein
MVLRVVNQARNVRPGFMLRECVVMIGVSRFARDFRKIGLPLPFAKTLRIGILENLSEPRKHWPKST